MNIKIKKLILYTLRSLFLGLILCSCATRTPIVPGEVPIQAELDPQEIKYGAAVFNQLSSQYPIEDDIKMNNRVRRIVDRLSDSISSEVGNPWHIYIFRDDSVKNAAATRGNYIFVWTGIIKNTKNDAELATILAHEMSHVLADHTRPTPMETMNRVVSSVSREATSSVLRANGYGALGNLAGSLVGALYDGIFVNPESQRVEIEADTIGMFLMAKAKYDPKNALNFWKAAKLDPALASDSLNFLSTHPNSDERIDNIEKHLAEATKNYKNNLKNK